VQDVDDSRDQQECGASRWTVEDGDGEEQIGLLDGKRGEGWLAISMTEGVEEGGGGGRGGWGR